MLRFAAKRTELKRTLSSRGVTLQPAYGHGGPLLTVEEFIRMAADRGVRLEIIEIGNRRVLTNGIVGYPLRRSFDDQLPDDARYSMCRLFGLPYLDFALDERGED